jgi:hypothetical protein
MRRSNGFFLLLVVAFAACGDDGTGAADTDTDATGSSSSGEAPPADDSTTAAADDTTGPMAETMLDPCDPLAAAPCDEGVCAGAPQAGFYCRPACSSMAEVGDDCGAEGVCLPVGYGEGLACVDLTTCDLTSADGCDLAAGESCVAVSIEPLRTACVPSGTTGAGMSCAPGGMHACDVGLACLGSDLEGGDPGLCTPLCLPEDPLPPGCALCIPLNDEIGTCSECSVLDDQCPAGSQCQPVNELLGGVCVPHGPGGPGDPCTIGGADGCQADHLCLETDVDDVFACTPVCDPAAPMCPGELSCVDLGALDLGFYISFSGVLTFRNADPLRAIARGLPRDRVMVETDCPFLAPVPMRGKENEPSFIVHTASCLASLWEVDEEEVRRATSENAVRLFGLPVRSEGLR